MSEPPGALSDQALFEIAYAELRRLASSYLRKERLDHTLQTSSLVNEVYLRLARGKTKPFQDRQHYIRVASHAMRCVLVDHARRRGALKREAGERIDLDQAAPVHGGNLEEILTIDAALAKLSGIDPRQAEIVELRFFGGLSVTETAEALEISEKTVKRDWSVARAWLRGELDQAAQM
jgi:RNA polymerase sigma factor (TIGR02999 family)